MTAPVRKRTVYVEGIVAAGKSELLNWFSGQENIAIVPEPVERWRFFHRINALELMYSRPEQYASCFQHLVYLTMSTRVPFDDRRTTLYERSIQSSFAVFSKYLKRAGYLTDLDMGVLEEMKNLLENRVTGPVDIVFYLKVDPIIALERIRSRGRQEEKGITLENLTTMDKFYDQWIQSLLSQGKQVFQVGANGATQTIGEECMGIIHEMDRKQAENGSTNGTWAEPPDYATATYNDMAGYFGPPKN